MDFINTKFQKKKQDKRSKSQGKKHGLDKRIHLRGGELGSEKKNRDFVREEVWNKRTVEARCLKCGRSDRNVRDCKAQSRAQTTQSTGNTKREGVQKSRKFNQGRLKITELGAEEELGNESVIHHLPSNVLYDTLPLCRLNCIMQETR